MKNLSSILFSFIAITVIFAHSVTPHHFHEDTVCIESSFKSEKNHSNTDCCHANHEHSDATHNHSEEGHHHDAKDASCKCILNNIDFLISTQIKTECKSIEYKDLLKSSISIQTVLENLFNIEFDQNKILYSHHPLITKLKIYYSRTHGFRAPPIA